MKLRVNKRSIKLILPFNVISIILYSLTLFNRKVFHFHSNSSFQFGFWHKYSSSVCDQLGFIVLLILGQSNLRKYLVAFEKTCTSTRFKNHHKFCQLFFRNPLIVSKQQITRRVEIYSHPCFQYSA